MKEKRMCHMRFFLVRSTKQFFASPEKFDFWHIRFFPIRGQRCEQPDNVPPPCCSNGDPDAAADMDNGENTRHTTSKLIIRYHTNQPVIEGLGLSNTKRESTDQFLINIYLHIDDQFPTSNLDESPPQESARR